MYILFYVLVLVAAFFISKRKSNLALFALVFSVFFALNLVVYNISIDQGKEGYSIFTKDILNDEIVYYTEAKFHYNRILGKYSPEQLEEAKNILGNNFYSRLISCLFLLFDSTDLMLVRGLTAMFSGVFFVQVNRFIQLINNSERIHLSILLLFFYPTLTIRGLQIEQEMLVNSIMVGLMVSTQDNKWIVQWIQLISLYWFKIIAFVSIIGAWIKKKSHVKMGMLLQAFILPVLILYGLKWFSPATFEYVSAVKAYVVMDGRSDIIPVDYGSVYGILKTMVFSWYYYLFAPLDLGTLSGGGISFRILLLEPFFLICGLFFIFRFRKKLSGFKNLIFISYALFYYSLIYIMGESHVTSLFRRRVIVYVFVFLLLVFIKSKLRLVYKKPIV